MEPDFRTGADILVAESFASLDGLRVGLIANQTSRSGDGHLADLIHDAPNVELVALFGPEHGLRGDADAGLAVEDGVDDRTGVPVYSLYGSRREPDPAVLAGIDVLVFDIQDIGARFYTYIATMGESMEAAAQAGVPFVVLDRPNPLGGLLVDGYVLEPGFESFVGPYPIPIQHGMTVGELAAMVKGQGWIEGADSLDLSVVEVEGWTRAELWSDAEAWIPTSPNIPRFENALVYPGMCLLEATTANEGRGTPNPFLQFGAPGLDNGKVVGILNTDVPGVAAQALTYAPESIPGKSTNPRHLGTSLNGVTVTVNEPSEVRPLALGIAVLRALVDQQGPEVLRQAGMARLAGTDRLYEALVRGDDAKTIVESWAEEVRAFEELRRPYLLYD
ncbi:MAG: DUF1343 domain-containing protein [Rhodothermales bacterium]|nr:DUF1343 domain-containing protein [Rhodothermales bacterium]